MAGPPPGGPAISADRRRRCQSRNKTHQHRHGTLEQNWAIGALRHDGRDLPHAAPIRRLARISVGGQGTDGNAAVPLGPAWLARPTNTNLHALDGCPPRSAGTGARFSAQEIASTLTGHRSSGIPPRRGCLASCLSFCLIRLRPAPFTIGRPDRVRSGRGRWRAPVNAGQHCWKACWGQPLRSSNLLSSAILTCGKLLVTRPVADREGPLGGPWAQIWAHFGPRVAVKALPGRARQRPAGLSHVSLQSRSDLLDDSARLGTIRLLLHRRLRSVTDSAGHGLGLR